MLYHKNMKTALITFFTFTLVIAIENKSSRSSDIDSLFDENKSLRSSDNDSLFGEIWFNDDLDGMCVHCLQKKASTIFQTCKHIICKSCFRDYDLKQLTNCKICQENIEKFRRIEKLPVNYFEANENMDLINQEVGKKTSIKEE
ncbi:uncharacterized protein LOC126904716 [Daktulosphaira vitifoliae]|uniref:uncharacterized protein LOC126904716 n=1 Tax=Daktulosphaira vitifoliae TaxID=58002 RepID=UPI0021AA41E4|nr:uncharacterized protein LOC126904716 [Daktulosphaira vitifoliae]